MTARQGQFVWFDVMTSDIERARAFYTGLFGWTVLPFGDDGDYEMFAVDGRPFGGVVAIPDALAAQGVPSHWFAHVLVDDVDVKTAQAEALGGAVVKPPTDIATVGRHSVITDPQGAVISLFTPEHDPPPSRGDEAPVPGQLCWHELMTTEPEAALDFYGQLLGYNRSKVMEVGDGATYQLFSIGEAMGGGVMALPPEARAGGVPPHWVHYTAVEDVEASVERARALGGALVHGPVDVPGARIAVLEDPTGAVFAVWTGRAQG